MKIYYSKEKNREHPFESLGGWSLGGARTIGHYTFQFIKKDDGTLVNQNASQFKKSDNETFSISEMQYLNELISNKQIILSRIVDEKTKLSGVEITKADNSVLKYSFTEARVSELCKEILSCCGYIVEKDAFQNNYNSSVYSQRNYPGQFQLSSAIKIEEKNDNPSNNTNESNYLDYLDDEEKRQVALCQGRTNS
ncbi:MAG: hypothetical protein K2Q14_05650 [Gammaproteobacteria bacterium]|nr:hypothetical protein [Gammaproteobacteria bacterium]